MRGDRIKALREKLGYTHEQLAQILDVGYASIYRYESGKNSPPADVLEKMADVFGVSTDYLLGRNYQSDSLSDKEQRVVYALRRGDIREAIKEIVSD